MAGDLPKFFLIVATRNRPEKVAHLLDSLAAQTMSDFIVLIADQSDEAQRVAVRALVKRHRDTLQIEYHEVPGVGIARARNHAMQFARGELLAFPDDDCWYAPDLLERVHQLFVSRPGYSLLTGRYTEPGVTNARFPAHASELVPWTLFSCASSITLFIRLEAVRSMRFDERLGVGTDLPAGEEIDFLLRAVAKGVRGRYEPEILVFHPVLRPAVTELKARLSRETANAYVLLRNARRSRPGVLHARLFLRLAKDLVQSSFSGIARARLKSRIIGYRRAIFEP
jgi:glycosyltransferase involved in cell wall biosynthesis